MIELSQIIEVDEDLCLNCHTCISVCPIKYCNDGSGDYVVINKNLCIGCGNCLHACTHNARIIIDDFKIFLDNPGKDKYIAIVAPSIASNFPYQSLEINGFLKSLGVEAFFDVSFGADLTSWSYYQYIKKHHPSLVIAQPCPSIVDFIQIYSPELIPYLAPVDSPMLHTVKMIRSFYPQYEGYKIVAISPCIGKKREFDETGFDVLNVTFHNLKKYIRDNKINIHDYPQVDYINPMAEKATLFSSPGGLLKSVERFLPGISNKARKIEGPESLYKYFHALEHDPEERKNIMLIDCLNCAGGCNMGTGTGLNQFDFDKIEGLIAEREKERSNSYSKFGFLKKWIFRHILKKKWENDLYKREYRDLSENNIVKLPSYDELNRIYTEMNKFTDEDIYNCCSCGYNSCEGMATAIYNGLNKPENCHHFIMDELKVAMNKADESNKLKTAFLANMSHEIRTPLNGILGFSSLLFSDKNLKGEYQEYIDVINNCSNQLLTIISDILDISQIDAGQLKINKTSFNLNNLMNEVYLLFKRELQEQKKNISLIMDTSLEDAHAMIYTDKVRLRQLLINLISNGIKFTSEGMIEFSYNVLEEKEMLHFMVHDTGCGIAEEHQKKIFDRFFQINKNPELRGTGLGLSICHGIVDLMGGEIWVNSKPGEGSYFYFTLPYILDKTIRIPEKTELPKASVINEMKGKNVLVVEDEIVNYKYLEKILMRKKMNLFHAVYGKDAIGILANTPIDLVLLDIRLPDTNGYEVAKLIRKTNTKIPIIAQTAYAMEDDRQKCIDAGCNDYIAKPINESQLMNLINNYLD